MKIQESAENYLEAILILMQKNGQVRSIDVAHYTGFSKPSISRAVGLLRDNGYVSIDQNGLLGLTEAGLKIAETIYERHTVLTDLLTKLGVSPETAAEDACRIEHVISAETFDKHKEHVRKSGALAGKKSPTQTAAQCGPAFPFVCKRRALCRKPSNICRTV